MSTPRFVMRWHDLSAVSPLVQAAHQGMTERPRAMGQGMCSSAAKSQAGHSQQALQERDGHGSLAQAHLVRQHAAAACAPLAP